MGDWLQVYNVADVVHFIEAFRKIAEQYYPDKIDVCEDVIGIPGISMTYILNKSLKKKKGLSYINQQTFVMSHFHQQAHVEIYKKSSSTVVVMVLIVKNVGYTCRPWKGVSVKRQPFMIC